MNLIGNLELIDNVFDGGDFPELSRPNGIATTKINGTDYLFVAGTSDDGIQVMEVRNDGTLEAVFSFANGNGTNALNDPQELEIVERDGNKYLIAVSTGSDSIASYRIDQADEGTDGFLTEESKLFRLGVEGTGNALYDPNYVEPIEIGNRTFLAVTSTFGNGLATYEIDDEGNLTEVDEVFDGQNQDFRLGRPGDVENLRIRGTEYLFVSADNDDGVSVWEIDRNGELENVENIALNRSPYDLLPIEFNGENRLFVSTSSRTVQTYDIANDGTLSFVNETNLGFYLTGLDKVTLDGVDFIIGSDPFGASLYLLTSEDDGTVSAVQSVSDTVYDGSGEHVVLEIAGETYIFSTHPDRSNVVSTKIAGGDDAVLGTSDDDSMAGLTGDDDLVGRGGDDMMAGGDGEDVLSGRTGDDTLMGGSGEDALVGGSGNDLLIGGRDGDLISGGGGKDTLSYESSRSGVTIDLVTGLAKGGDADGDFFRSIEDIVGSDENDRLTGDNGRNKIDGGRGNDHIDGGSGEDALLGGGGSDKLIGGTGSDKVFGQNGNDIARGQGGRDRLSGQDGDDLLYGNKGNDSLIGGNGNDTLVGGGGDDELRGKRGADTFVFQGDFGADEIVDFETSRDVIDFSQLAEISSLSDFQNAAQTFAGNTLVSVNEGASTIVISRTVESDFTEDNFIFVA